MRGAEACEVVVDHLPSGRNPPLSFHCHLPLHRHFILIACLLQASFRGWSGGIQPIWALCADSSLREVSISLQVFGCLLGIAVIGGPHINAEAFNGR